MPARTPARTQPKRQAAAASRSKRSRPASQDITDNDSEKDFETDTFTPRTYVRKQSKKRRVGSLKEKKKSKDTKEESCEKCNENKNDSKGVILTDEYRDIEKTMNRLFDFKPREFIPRLPGGSGSLGCGKSVLDFLSQRQSRGSVAFCSEPASQPVIDLISNLQLYRTASPFDRRVTSMAWHPQRQNILAVGSKGGDIIIWDTDQINNEMMIQGIGAGGSIQAMKFWPYDTNFILTSSINGTVKLHDIHGKKTQVLADTFNCMDFWYCCVDVNPTRRMVVTGDNAGNLKLITPDGNEIMTSRLHKNKITHAEFSPREDWLLCTASTDQTVKMWDVRKMKERKDCLEVLKHDKPINSAYFSLSDGCRLLTTDQGNELRVYRAPTWHLERVILHPHRFFQHITPIKANWHPHQDLIVVGRYPDPKFPGYVPNELRSTDVYSADTGQKVVELYDPAANGIKSLHRFNILGDRMAVAMGFNILLWTRKEHAAEKQEELMNKFKGQGRQPSGGQGQSGRSRPQPRPRKKKDNEDEDDIGKLKKKVRSKVSQKKKDS